MILVNVRWHDGYIETFKCSEVRQGAFLLWLKLLDGQNKNIPLVGNVRWFSTDPGGGECSRSVEYSNDEEPVFAVIAKHH